MIAVLKSILDAADVAVGELPQVLQLRKLVTTGADEGLWDCLAGEEGVRGFVPEDRDGAIGPLADVELELVLLLQDLWWPGHGFKSEVFRKLGA
jgi:hypothetical protein